MNDSPKITKAENSEKIKDPKKVEAGKTYCNIKKSKREDSCGKGRNRKLLY